jgi:hypothetical protein
MPSSFWHFFFTILGTIFLVGILITPFTLFHDRAATTVSSKQCYLALDHPAHAADRDTTVLAVRHPQDRTDRPQ